MGGQRREGAADSDSEDKMNLRTVMKPSINEL